MSTGGTLTKVLAAIAALAGVVVPILAPVITKDISAHPQIAAVVATAATILSLFHVPTKAN